MKELVLFDKTQNSILGNVRSDGDMLSLTDLWKAANSPNKKTHLHGNAVNQQLNLLIQCAIF